MEQERRSSRSSVALDVDPAGEIDKVREMLQGSSLSTAELVTVEDEAEVLHRLQQRVKLAEDAPRVFFIVGILAPALLFARTFLSSMPPFGSFFSVLLLNLERFWIFDELLVMGGLVYHLGAKRVWESCQHAMPQIVDGAKQAYKMVAPLVNMATARRKQD